MSKKMKIIIPVAGLAIIIILAIILFFKPNGYRSIHILEMGGIVTYDRGADKDVAVYDNMSLTSGDTMRTQIESFARMSLDDTKYVYMEQSSEVNFVLDRGLTNLNLTKGAIINEIEKKLGPDETYEVKTPNALMAVRGTKFRVSVYLGEDGIYYTRFSTIEGTIECRLVYPDSSVSNDVVTVSAGEEALVYYDAANNETDYVKFDEAGDPYHTTGVDIVREIRYNEMPLQVLEYLKIRLDENPEYADITPEYIEDAILLNNILGEPVMFRDNPAEEEVSSDLEEENAEERETYEEETGETTETLGSDTRNPQATVIAQANTPSVQRTPSAAAENNQSEFQPLDGAQETDTASLQPEGDTNPSQETPLEENTLEENTLEENTDEEILDEDENNQDGDEDINSEEEKEDNKTPANNTPSNHNITPDRPYFPDWNPGGDTPGGDTPGGDVPGGDTPGGDTPGGDPVNPTPGNTGTTQNDFNDAIHNAVNNPTIPLEVKDGGQVVLDTSNAPTDDTGNLMTIENPINISGNGSSITISGDSTDPDNPINIDGKITVGSGSTANIGDNVNTYSGITVNNGGTVNINNNSTIRDDTNSGPGITVNGGNVNLKGDTYISGFDGGPGISVSNGGNVNLTDTFSGGVSISGLSVGRDNAIDGLTYNGNPCYSEATTSKLQYSTDNGVTKTDTDFIFSQNKDTGYEIRSL